MRTGIRQDRVAARTWAVPAERREQGGAQRVHHLLRLAFKLH